MGKSCGRVMASWLVISTPYQVVQVRALASENSRCVLGQRHFTLTHSGDTFGTTEKDLYNGREEDRNLGTMI